MCTPIKVDICMYPMYASCKNPAPIWNDSKPKNCWYYLIDADAIAFFMASKGKKVNKKTNKKQN